MPLRPGVCSIALKEWAVVVNALAKDNQIIVLRKGSIHLDDKEFRMVHPEFLFYPTYEHQEADLLKSHYHRDLAETRKEDGASGLVTLSYWSEVTDVLELGAEEMFERLSSFHVWTS